MPDARDDDRIVRHLVAHVVTGFAVPERERAQIGARAGAAFEGMAAKRAQRFTQPCLAPVGGALVECGEEGDETVEIAPRRGEARRGASLGFGLARFRHLGAEFVERLVEGDVFAGLIEAAQVFIPA